MKAEQQNACLKSLKPRSNHKKTASYKRSGFLLDKCLITFSEREQQEPVVQLVHQQQDARNL